MSELDAGGLFLGKYHVVRKLGEGAMGDVYEAHDAKHQRRVAIKLLKPEIAARSDVRARFEREAQAAGQLDSDHTVRVFDSGEVAEGGLRGSQYIIMEFLRGSDLQKFESAGQALPVGVAAELVLQACRGLESAHRKGVIHRDIKPANLFVMETEDGDVRLKVVDFGISKVRESAGITGDNQALGTIYYMSPEQLKQTKSVDRRTDIWALGATLYVLVTGTHPFEAETMGELFGMICVADPVRPIERNPSVPPAIDAIILRCLEKDPSRRFQTMADFGKALAPYADAAETARVPFFERPAASNNAAPIAHTADDIGSPMKTGPLPYAAAVAPDRAPKTTSAVMSSPMATSTSRGGASRFVIPVIATTAGAALATYLLFAGTFAHPKQPAAGVAQTAPTSSEPTSKSSAPPALATSGPTATVPTPEVSTGAPQSIGSGPVAPMQAAPRVEPGRQPQQLPQPPPQPQPPHPEPAPVAPTLPPSPQPQPQPTTAPNCHVTHTCPA